MYQNQLSKHRSSRMLRNLNTNILLTTYYRNIRPWYFAYLMNKLLKFILRSMSMYLKIRTMKQPFSHFIAFQKTFINDCPVITMLLLMRNRFQCYGFVSPLFKIEIFSSEAPLTFIINFAQQQWHWTSQNCRPSDKDNTRINTTLNDLILNENFAITQLVPAELQK